MRLNGTVLFLRGPGKQGQFKMSRTAQKNRTVPFIAYPDPNASIINMVTGLDVSGVIHPDTRIPIQTITIPTTPAQDQAMQNLINRTTQNPGNYNLYNRNCSTFVQDILNAGGTHCPGTNRPRTLMNNLLGGQCR
jgi:hypothetical protein